MKKITLFLAATVLLLNTASAQYSMVPHPESRDQLAAEFPRSYHLGDFWGSYVGAGMPAFTDIEITIKPKKFGLDVSDFSKITNVQINLLYNDSLGYHNVFYTPVTYPSVTGLIAHLTFPVIIPSDGSN